MVHWCPLCFFIYFFTSFGILSTYMCAFFIFIIFWLSFISVYTWPFSCYGSIMLTFCTVKRLNVIPPASILIFLFNCIFFVGSCRVMTFFKVLYFFFGYFLVLLLMTLNRGLSIMETRLYYSWNWALGSWWDRGRCIYMW